MNITAVETTAGDCLLVQVDEAAATVQFMDELDAPVAAYTFETFATVRAALALDFIGGLVIDAATVAGVQQFADLDAFGLRARASL